MADRPILPRAAQAQITHALRRAPVVAVVGRRLGDHLLDDESLPGRADARVQLQGVRRAAADQVVVDAGVAQVDLGALDLPLAQVLVPWAQLADEEQVLQQVEVASHGRLGGAEGCRQLATFRIWP